jgi:hypothetical protein
MSLATIQIGQHMSVQGDLGDTWRENGKQMASVAMGGKLYVGQLVEPAAIHLKNINLDTSEKNDAR